MQASLDTPAIQIYLRLADAAKASAATLHKMFMQAPKGDKADAVWDGYWSLKTDAERHTRALRDAGGLLFLGSAAALAAAREAEEMPA